MAIRVELRCDFANGFASANSLRLLRAACNKNLCACKRTYDKEHKGKLQAIK